MNKDNNYNNDTEKIEAGEIVVQKNGFAKWIENFWYHNKWTIIIVTFFVVILIVGAVQIFSNEEEDLQVTYSGPYILSSSEKAEINKVLVSLMPKDYNGDGKKLVAFMDFGVYSERELERENEAYTDENGKYVTMVFPQTNTENMKSYSDYLMTGECSVLFLSEYLYGERMASAKKHMVPLTDTFGAELPQGAMSDGYGIRLGDTYLYASCPALQVLPEDTVICLNRPYAIGASSNKKVYERSVDFYKTLVTFTGE